MWDVLSPLSWLGRFNRHDLAMEGTLYKPWCAHTQNHTDTLIHILLQSSSKGQLCCINVAGRKELVWECTQLLFTSPHADLRPVHVCLCYCGCQEGDRLPVTSAPSIITIMVTILHILMSQSVGVQHVIKVQHCVCLGHLTNIFVVKMFLLVHVLVFVLLLGFTFILNGTLYIYISLIYYIWNGTAWPRKMAFNWTVI